MTDERSPDMTQALLLELRAQLEQARRERDEAEAYEEYWKHATEVNAGQLAERTIAAEQAVKVAESLAAEKAALVARVGVLSAALEVEP